MGGSLELPLLGIAAGFVAHYIDVIYPASNNNSRLVHTPQFLVDWFPNPVSGGLSGEVPVTRPNQQQPTTRASWGSGRKLGSE